MSFSIPFLLNPQECKDTNRFVCSESDEMSACFAFRHPFNIDDHRIVVLGLSYTIHTVFYRQITQSDINQVEEYLSKHGDTKSQNDWPKNLWQDIVTNNNGKLPFKVMALHGSDVVFPGTPIFVITGPAKYSKLAPWLENALMRICSTSIDVTRDRHIWQLINDYFDKTVDHNDRFLIGWRFPAKSFCHPATPEQLKSRANIHQVRLKNADCSAQDVLDCLDSLANSFGFVINEKGYRVITGAEIEYQTFYFEKIKETLKAVATAGYSVQNIVFGTPVEFFRSHNHETIKGSIEPYSGTTDMLEVVYDNGATDWKPETLKQTQDRINTAWSKLTSKADEQFLEPSMEG